MQEQKVKSVGGGDVQDTDIVFECPQCGKSLAIDPRGAGFVVTCPDCQTQVQVPLPPEETGAGTVIQEAEEDDVPDLPSQLHQLQRLHHMDRERLKQISAEIGLIQASIDRMVGLLDEAEPPAP